MSRYYRLLGVSRFADRAEIREAYWSLTRRLRSESRGSGEDSTRLAEARRAFDVLSDSCGRRDSCSRRGDRGLGVSDRRSTSARERDIETRLAADETSTGFPSMSRLVPRMLTGFYGVSDQPTHMRRVALTPRQALAGFRVPMDLMVHPTCPACGGRGEMWPSQCHLCEGTGSGSFSHPVQFPIPPGVRDGARLRYSVSPPFAAEALVELRIAIQ